MYIFFLKWECCKCFSFFLFSFFPVFRVFSSFFFSFSGSSLGFGVVAFGVLALGSCSVAFGSVRSLGSLVGFCVFACFLCFFRGARWLPLSGGGGSCFRHSFAPGVRRLPGLLALFVLCGFLEGHFLVVVFFFFCFSFVVFAYAFGFSF